MNKRGWVNNWLNKNVCLSWIFLSAVCSLTWASELPDPTRPLTYKAQQVNAPELNLQAVLQSRSGRKAIVNGQSVGVGSLVDGARIEKISDHGIVYSYRGQQHSQRLRPEIITR